MQTAGQQEGELVSSNIDQAEEHRARSGVAQPASKVGPGITSHAYIAIWGA